MCNPLFTVLHNEYPRDSISENCTDFQALLIDCELDHTELYFDMKMRKLLLLFSKSDLAETFTNKHIPIHHPLTPSKHSMRCFKGDFDTVYRKRASSLVCLPFTLYRLLYNEMNYCMKHTSGFGLHPPVFSAQSLARDARDISSPRVSDESGRNFSKLDLLVILLARAV